VRFRALKSTAFAVTSTPRDIAINQESGKLRGSKNADIKIPNNMAISRIAIFNFMDPTLAEFRFIELVSVGGAKKLFTAFVKVDAALFASSIGPQLGNKLPISNHAKLIVATAGTTQPARLLCDQRNFHQPILIPISQHKACIVDALILTRSSPHPNPAITSMPTFHTIYRY
jgi:hypothetical protein